MFRYHKKNNNKNFHFQSSTIIINIFLLFYTPCSLEVKSVLASGLSKRSHVTWFLTNQSQGGEKPFKVWRYLIIFPFDWFKVCHVTIFWPIRLLVASQTPAKLSQLTVLRWCLAKFVLLMRLKSNTSSRLGFWRSQFILARNTVPVLTLKM